MARTLRSSRSDVGGGEPLGETLASRFGHNERAGDPSESAAYPQQLRVKINLDFATSSSERT
jgi:hypothetical protein